MSNYPISLMEFSDVLRKMDISDISVASIRQCQAVGQEIEGITGEPFVHLEMGIPGINLHDIGVNAQEKALEMGSQDLPSDRRNQAPEAERFPLHQGLRRR